MEPHYFRSGPFVLFVFRWGKSLQSGKAFNWFLPFEGGWGLHRFNSSQIFKIFLMKLLTVRLVRNDYTGFCCSRKGTCSNCNFLSSYFQIKFGCMYRHFPFSFPLTKHVVTAKTWRMNCTLLFSHSFTLKHAHKHTGGLVPEVTQSFSRAFAHNARARGGCASLRHNPTLRLNGIFKINLNYRRETHTFSVEILKRQPKIKSPLSRTEIRIQNVRQIVSKLSERIIHTEILKTSARGGWVSNLKTGGRRAKTDMAGSRSEISGFSKRWGEYFHGRT